MVIKDVNITPYKWGRI